MSKKTSCKFTLLMYSSFALIHATSMWKQKEIIIKNKSRGFHLINDEILKNLPELKKINIGILQLIQDQLRQTTKQMIELLTVY